VKVCGITTYRDAAVALDLGADALGFNFYPGSPRFVTPDAARSIIRKLPPLTTTVAVFVNEEDTVRLERAARLAGVNCLQLHGEETPEYCRLLSHWKLIKALRIGPGMRPRALAGFRVSALLLDARDPLRYGGTGRTLDWSARKGIKTSLPIILAGGLRAGNVAEAIREVRPYAVDVCSGVEKAPGKKDPGKLASFMNEVRNAERIIGT
jgi:phosphoribosylanthranilate isomerase